MTEGRSADHTPSAIPTSAISSEQRSRLDRLMAEARALAAELDGQPQALLELLRELEGLHRSIQDGPFRGSLPSDRQELFDLLQGMERSGGWPYIPRLQLRTFMELLLRDRPAEGSALAA